MRKYIFKYLILFVSIGLFHCKNDAVSETTPNDPSSESHLKNATLLYEVSFEDLQSLANALGQTEFLEKITNGIAAYKIVYKTTYQNQPIDASGVLYMPTNLASPAPILSLQHGTTFIKTDVPSTAGSFSGFEYFAAGGFITFMPDFLGYGESAAIFHPYYDLNHSALAVIDLIKAGKEFLEDENIPFNDQLFLAGYSEGGYVSMAAAKEIDLNSEHGLKTTAIAAGAGGYDLTEMLENIKENSEYSYPAYLAFVIMSYNETYDWGHPLSYFFNEEYAAKLPFLMDGKKGGDQINAQLTTDLNKLFNPEFYESIKNGGQSQFVSALIQNSMGIDNWAPSAPTRLYHGTNDIIIPLSNSQNVYERFKNNNAEDVKLIEIEGGTHGSTIIPMIRSLIPWFESLVLKES